MSEFLGMDNWDLQSVVRGCFNDFSTSTAMAPMDNPPPCFSPNLYTQENIDHLIFNSFPANMFDTTTIFDELDQLYKPFYPILNPISVSEDHDDQLEKVQLEKQPIASSPVTNIPSVSTTTTSSSTAHVNVAKCKRRKTQHKRVVIQVTAEGLSSDLWAWRKYGQKPIKGSPFPRSYYRCSSSKGCLARRQVEQSCSEPGMFIMTYTAEHNHSQPTRRNSLAGTTRHRFSTSKNPTSTTAHSDMPTPKNSPPALSPTTPLSTNIESEFSPPALIKKESREEYEQMAEDMIFNNDFFVGLDGLDDFDFV